MRRAPSVEITPAERRELEAWARSGAQTSRRAVRARIVLEAADGRTNEAIARRLDVHVETVGRWRARFALNGPEGLAREAPRTGAARRVSRSAVRRIVRETVARPPGADRGWTTRSLARSLHVNHMLVHRVWKAQHLDEPAAAPGPRSRSSVPRLDLVGAFVTGSARALVFSVEERPAGPRRSTDLPELFPNPTSHAGFSGPEAAAGQLAEALDALEDAPRPRPSEATARAAFLVFLRGLEERTPRSVRLEVILDRPVAGLGRRVARWLGAHGRFRLYRPPPGRPWPGAVADWLRRWEPGGLERGSLAGVAGFTAAFLAPEADRRPQPLRPSWSAPAAPRAGPGPWDGRPPALPATGPGPEHLGTP